jgi:hypothetical protein
MPFSVVLLLVVVAFICTIAAAANRCPLWVPVLLVVLVQLLQLAPR